MHIIRFSTIDSTNEYLKKNYEHLCHETICISETQTQGRGRYNRSWHDDGSSCLFSILLKDDLDKEKISLYPLMIAYLVHKALMAFKIELSIKWPNDIYYKDKKIAGILLESIITKHDVQAVIIGIGINTNTKHFPDEIKDQSTSLFIETNNIINHDELILRICECLNETTVLIQADFNHIVSYLNRYNYLKDQIISYMEQGKIYHAKVLNIADDGTLLVLRDQERYSLSSGEVLLVKE
jgi:BirA family biotin operon repressor/biotin-[acetyl-CoA-carboxylase] ligase